ncbi:MAG: zinc-binding dehydrogenase, partial [Methylococcales bacterium]
MKAVVLSAPENTGPLKYLDMPDPVIQSASQVLVRLKAAGINPIDIKIRNNPGIFPLAQPFIPGFDGAGVIEATGLAVTGFAIGDEVYFCKCAFHGEQGTYAEYAVVDQALLALKPKSLNFEHSTSIPLVLITAWEALFDRISLKSGQSVLIQAGAGGVGQLAIQLARMAGAEVYTTVSSPEKAELVRSLGADHVILYREQEVIPSILEKTAGRGVDVSLDTLGGPIFEQCIECTRHYGDLVSILQPGPDVNWTTARLRNLRISLEMMLSPSLSKLSDSLKHQGDILRQCAGRFDTGELRIKVAHTFPLQEAY